MTIQESSSILIGYFIKNDSITNEHFNSLKPKKVSEIEAEAAFTYSLQEMELKNIVSKFIGANSEGKAIFVWVLKQPLILNKQTLEIDGGTAIAVANACNNFFQETENFDSFCNPLQITQDDILLLLELIDILASQQIEPQDTKKE